MGHAGSYLPGVHGTLVESFNCHEPGHWTAQSHGSQAAARQSGDARRSRMVQEGCVPGISAGRGRCFRTSPRISGPTNQFAAASRNRNAEESRHRPGLQPDPSHTSVRACVQFLDTSTHRVVMTGSIRIGKRYFPPTDSHYITRRWFVCPGDSTLCVREVPTRVEGIILTTPASPRSLSCRPTACGFLGPLSRRIRPHPTRAAANAAHILSGAAPVYWGVAFPPARG